MTVSLFFCVKFLNKYFVTDWWIGRFNKDHNTQHATPARGRWEQYYFLFFKYMRGILSLIPHVISYPIVPTVFAQSLERIFRDPCSPIRTASSPTCTSSKTPNYFFILWNINNLCQHCKWRYVTRHNRNLSRVLENELVEVKHVFSTFLSFHIV